MLRRLWAALLPWWGRLPIPDRLRWVMLWTVNQKFLVGVGAVVFDDAGRVLLFKHTYRQDFLWGLPGGWLEQGEDAARAVEREVREETGLEVCAGAPVCVEHGRKFASLYITFLGQAVGGVFRPSAEVSQVGYFGLDELPPLHRDTVAIIRAAAQLYSGEKPKVFSTTPGSSA